MRLRRLQVQSFAGVRNVSIDFCPGLNVLYGPNDLGKSSLVDAIRLALLLPHGSSYADAFVPWSGGGGPRIQLCFETEPQRIWRVTKAFGRAGTSLLEQSRNGQDFDECERGRAVDGRLRELLEWGVPSPGGTGGPRGLPQSFLATALLTSQAEVGAILRQSLAKDETNSGRDQISAALQAVSQDPLFVAILTDVQARYDNAFTATGNRKSARGSTFKVASDRVNEKRIEVERLRHIVFESESVEREIQELSRRVERLEHERSNAQGQVQELELSEAQSIALSDATRCMSEAEAAVQRIQRLDSDIASAEQAVARLDANVATRRTELASARERHATAQSDLRKAEDQLRDEQAAPGAAEAVARKDAELRIGQAQKALSDAEQAVQAVANARQVEQTVSARRKDVEREQAAENAARETADQIARKAVENDAQLKRCDEWERALRLIQAEHLLARAETNAASKAKLDAERASARSEHARLRTAREAIVVPAKADIPELRRIDAAWKTGKAGIALGLQVVLVPERPPLSVQVRRDGGANEDQTVVGETKISAQGTTDIVLPGLVRMTIAVGSDEQRTAATRSEAAWATTVQPALVAARVSEFQALEEKIESARQLDDSIREVGIRIETLDRQLADLPDVDAELTTAGSAVDELRRDVGDVSAIKAELTRLSSDPAKTVTTERARLVASRNALYQEDSVAASTLATSLERLRQCQRALAAIEATRDAVMTAFPQGTQHATIAAQDAQERAEAKLSAAQNALEALDQIAAEKRQRTESRLQDAKNAVADLADLVGEREDLLNSAVAAHAKEDGRLGELRTRRVVEDLEGAERELASRRQALSALPTPRITVTAADVQRARAVAASHADMLADAERELQRAHGALEQVGGAVAREQLREAEAGLELAERLERDVEADSEAWKLLRQELMEAEKAQARHLGDALVPAISDSFRALTRQRYQSVALTPDLGTEGVSVHGAVRDYERLSVGTREQLSTIYRVALAEYLKTFLVLDDQLVQSDGTRMRWFRSVMTEKAAQFQIIVFTCRPEDYLADKHRAPANGPLFIDSEVGVRAFDLGRALAVHA